MTGFRIAYGGAQEKFGITPDLTTLGKVIGGGLPVGAYGGRKDIMSMVAPSGPMYQAGTLSGNPLAMTAGIKTLELLQKLKAQRTLSLTGISRLPKGLISSTLAQTLGNHLLVITSSLEEAGRWAAQLEIMGWKTINFYPTSEASPYEALSAESEMIWGQMQVLSNLAELSHLTAIITTEKALQPHLPAPDIFQEYCCKI